MKRIFTFICAANSLGLRAKSHQKPYRVDELLWQLNRGTMNHWGIPDWLEKEVKERDKACVYCGIQMIEKMPTHGPRKAVATWEHIINDAKIITRENIARCCVACNASKGQKKLSEWLQSSYCKKFGISKDTVAPMVKEALRKKDR